MPLDIAYGDLSLVASMSVDHDKLLNSCYTDRIAPDYGPEHRLMYLVVADDLSLIDSTWIDSSLIDSSPADSSLIDSSLNDSSPADSLLIDSSLID